MIFPSRPSTQTLAAGLEWGAPPMPTVTKLCQILSSLLVVFCFARKTHACAYDAFTYVTFLMYDINVVH
jgi:hypothetical protein